MSQIALPFDWPAPENSDSFIVTAANRQAVDGIDRSSSWPVRAAILTGPRKSGRSLLGRIFAAKTGGTLIDDGEQHRETEIFHRWNAAQEERKPLLIVAMSPPPLWKVKLPDLVSRLVLVAMLLEKLLVQRGVQPSPGVVNYIATRIERSYIAMMRVIDALDSAALSQHRAVTIKLARVVLQDLHMMDGQENML